MKRLLSCLILVCLVTVSVFAGQRQMIPRYNKITKTWRSFPVFSIHELQYVPPDSLAKADVEQGGGNYTAPFWSKQASRFDTTLSKLMYGKYDTVVAVGVVVCPAHIITYTAKGFTMLLHDTAKTNTWGGSNPNQWGGILVREATAVNGYPSGYPDSIQAIADHFTNAEEGDVVMMTGVVAEFPQAYMNSTTQFCPIYGYSVDKVADGHVPAPTHVQVTDFNLEGYQSLEKQYSTGEPYEGSLVYLTDLTVVTYLTVTHDNGYGASCWVMADDAGNQITDYDYSHYFTYANEKPAIVGDPSFTRPVLGARIDTIRGTMGTASGAESGDGYRICPLYPGDVVYGISLPYLSEHRRYPVIVTPADSVQVQVSLKKLTGGYDVYKAILLTSINGRGWNADTLSLLRTTSNPDSNVYGAYILDPDGYPWPADTSVRYFFEALDVMGNMSVYANSSPSGGRDTSNGFFFYKVLNGAMKIHDIQYTPYVNGRSPYVGGIGVISGIVTADTTVFRVTPIYTGGTNNTFFGTSPYYIQDGSGPWNGIWVIPTNPTNLAQLEAVRVGDSVVIRGYIQERSEVTVIYDSSATVVSSGHPLPQPVNVSSHLFTLPNGDPGVEPYEGVLVRVVNARLSAIAPYYSDPTEYEINDGSGTCRVRRDGVNSYSNTVGDTASSKLILHETDRFDTLVGIVYFSFGAYKIDPRTDADFTVGEPNRYARGWNLISVGRDQLPASTGYNKSVLFPSSNSQAFAYQAGYTPTSVITPDVGYWLKFPADITIRQLGAKRTNDEVPVAAGWNLVGTIADSISTTTVIPLPHGNGLSSFFGYDRGYAVATTLVPSKGYWVKAGLTGSIVMASRGFAKTNPSATDLSQFNTITITDKNGYSQKLYFGEDATGKLPVQSFELPPFAPAGGMDVRYESGRVLEAYPEVLAQDVRYPILVNAAQAPLKITWNIVTQKNKRYTLSDAADGKLMKTTTLAAAGELTLGKSVTKLFLNVAGGAAVPKEFSLSQNYPNPFNPSTKFVVGLPQNSHLTVAIYNILGQKVATLVDEQRAEGYYTVTWNGISQNGTAVASGVYFARMNASSSTGSGQPFVSLKKILLMK